ncbi:MAG: hypothetical protein ABR540_17915 [Acidimicrobiales bacterium]
MVETLAAGTVADVLATRRRRRFVGRSNEVEWFRTALEASDPPFSVLYLHGPGGIGKKTLLEILGDTARGAERPSSTSTGGMPPALLGAIARGLRAPDCGPAHVEAPPLPSRSA